MTSPATTRPRSGMCRTVVSSLSVADLDDHEAAPLSGSRLSGTVTAVTGDGGSRNRSCPTARGARRIWRASGRSSRPRRLRAPELLRQRAAANQWSPWPWVITMSVTSRPFELIESPIRRAWSVVNGGSVSTASSRAVDQRARLGREALRLAVRQHPGLGRRLVDEDVVGEGPGRGGGHLGTLAPAAAGSHRWDPWPRPGCAHTRGARRRATRSACWGHPGVVDAREVGRVRDHVNCWPPSMS